MLKKIFLGVTVFFVLVACVGIGGGYLWYQNALQPASTDTKSKRLVIAKGASVTQIANKLQSEGLIKNALAFRIYTKLNNLESKLFAGEFQIAPNLGVPRLSEELGEGPSQLWITIPEGLRREEIARKFVEDLNLPESFEDEFLDLTVNMEGYLFPDTYLFPKDVTAQMAVTKLKNTFDQKIQFEVTPDQIILASILERETANANSEGPLVAGILIKRMKAGWPLQADATVQYALGDESDWWPVVSRADYETESVFNTYKIQGLPPHPIANPGLAAMTASVNPEESDYWYYIHDLEGRIHYGRTLDEHNANVDRYLR